MSGRGTAILAFVGQRVLFYAVGNRGYMQPGVPAVLLAGTSGMNAITKYHKPHAVLGREATESLLPAISRQT